MLYKECIEYNCCVRPKKIALIYEDKKYTFYELKNIINLYEDMYILAGVKRRDIVIIIGKNTDIFVIQVFLCMKMEVIFIPLSEKISSIRYEYILKNSNADFIFDISAGILTRNPFFSPKRKANYFAEKIQCIIYSSGSTSFPKGIMETENAMIFSVHKINERIKNTEKDNILVGIPLSFDYGLYQLFLGFSVGASIILLNGFDFVQRIPGIINKYGVTGLPLVPTVFELLLCSGRLNTKLNTLRYISSTGDTLNVESIQKFHNIFPNVQIIPMYGITECKRVFIMDNNWNKILNGSCGIPLDGIEVKIIDKNGHKVGIMEKGELIVSGKNVMAGYLYDNNSTNEVFHFSEKERTLKTGDIFYVDQDGYYYFCGRMNRFIKRRGIKISPEEIENHLKTIKEIEQCVVIGVPHKIEGETIVLIIKKYENVEEVIVRKNLTNFFHVMPPEWIPSNIIFTNRYFPVNINGKVDRNKVEKMYIKKC